MNPDASSLGSAADVRGHPSADMLRVVAAQATVKEVRAAKSRTQKAIAGSKAALLEEQARRVYSSGQSSSGGRASEVHCQLSAAILCCHATPRAAQEAAISKATQICAQAQKCVADITVRTPAEENAATCCQIAVAA